MAVAPAWRLTRSSELALDWAAQFAAMRGTGPTDSIDLLLGLLFAHPDSSEPGALLDNFRIPGSALAEALTDGHAGQRITATSAIPAAPRRRPADLAMTDDLLAVLDRAASLAEQFGADEGLTRNKDLFGALLSIPSPVSNALDGLLETRYVPLRVATLAHDYEEYLRVSSGGAPTPNASMAESVAPPPRTPVSYAEFLASRSPYSPRAFALPRYDADAIAAPPGSDDPDRPLIPDLVDIGGEVDAFAHLLTAKDLQPPLAIGLFGDWGSGKSFFMRELQRRIYQITARARTSGRPQRELPIYKSVAQIEFNAWHYVEGNLWASLVEHIFSNLRLSA
jgi:hypothetical protein